TASVLVRFPVLRLGPEEQADREGREGLPAGFEHGTCQILAVVAVTSDEARVVALSMPEAVEQDHHGRPSFRVGGKIFATLWSDEQLNVMLPGDRIEQVAADESERCEPIWWGKRLAAIRVHLPAADAALVEPLLAEAWQRRA